MIEDVDGSTGLTPFFAQSPKVELSESDRGCLIAEWEGRFWKGCFVRVQAIVSSPSIGDEGEEKDRKSVV